jgi:hypothetical protein
MATRSTIALEFADGTVQQIYCHWDGYLEHNGKILAEHYMDPFKVRSLIDGGSVSSLAASIDKPEGHSFDKSVDGYTVFYARDRGEELHVSKFADYADYRRRAQGEEYNYILRNVNGVATWFVEFYGEFDGLLEQAFLAESALED